MVPPNRSICSQSCLFLLVLLASVACVRSQTDPLSALPCEVEEQNEVCWSAGSDCWKYLTDGVPLYECCGSQGCRNPACREEDSDKCHVLAMCSMETGVAECFCEAGFFGSGEGEGEPGSSEGCHENAWSLRLVVNLPSVQCDSSEIDLAQGKLSPAFWHAHRQDLADLFFEGSAPSYVGINMIHDLYPRGREGCGDGWAGVQLSIGVLWGQFNKTTAIEASDIFAQNLNGAAPKTVFGQALNELVVGEGTYAIKDTIITYGPALLRHVAQTTGAPIQIAPVGFEVESVSFKPACMSSGCWVIDLIFTAGEDNFVVFYIPKTGLDTGDENGNFVDELAYDYDYSVSPPLSPWNEYSPPRTISSTFQPVNFPCSLSGPRHRRESCCLAEFADLYRPVASFVSGLSGENADGNDLNCVADADNLNCAGLVAACPKDAPYPESMPKIQRPGAPADPASGVYDAPTFTRFGRFAGMAESRIDLNGVVEPTIGIYRAQVQLDNVELRRFAGQLTGTVGVEYTIDTFIGMADIKPTGAGSTMLLDPMATQTAIHLEKTDFFQISSVQGVNDYTFIQYVNLRLVEVLQQDIDNFETPEENDDRFDRTDRSDPAHFLQLTFTLDEKYSPMKYGTPDAELIPFDGLRVAKGGALSQLSTQESFYHACDEYTTPQDGNVEFDAATKATFDSRFSEAQTCAPDAPMCEQPAEIQDGFINFNIPLGVGWLPDADRTLDSNVYVQLVITADDQEARSAGGAPPNQGGDPYQVKTTIFAEIPVVEGGRYIYCDRVVAKTDLKDVVDATLVFGTALDANEFTRLTVFENVGDSVLSPQDPVQFDSSSIEAGMMTLVLQGSQDFFNTSTGLGSDTYGVQLEDVLTIHIMEENPAFTDAGTASKEVLDLLALPAQDAYDPLSTPAELRTMGYELNGAFRFTIDRAAGTATLEPTRALLNVCQFNPPRPTLDDVFPTTCVIRKDVSAKQYLFRDGNFPTATEVAALGESTGGNQAFIGSILGDSDYSDNLGDQFSRVIAERYKLNGRFNRAYWINPGYEWTPTQIGGRPVFVVSQKLFLFALVTLDEGFSDGRRRLRRRLLTSTTSTENAGSAVASQATASFPSDKRTVLAAAFDQPEGHVTSWSVEMFLTRGQACNKDRKAVKLQVTEQLQAYFLASASNVANVQIADLVINMEQENCFGVSRNGRRAEGASVEASQSTAKSAAQALVVFSAAEAKINPVLFAEQLRVISLQPVNVGESYQLDPNFRPGEEEEEGGSSSSMVPIIAGAAGGAGCLLLSAVAFVMVRRGRRGGESASEEVVGIGTGALKDEVRRSMPDLAEIEELSGLEERKQSRLSDDQVNELKDALHAEMAMAQQV